MDCSADVRFDNATTNAVDVVDRIIWVVVPDGHAGGEPAELNTTVMCSPSVVQPRGKVTSCRFCPYVSTSSINVKRHERAHTGDKPFGCAHCTYRSARYVVGVPLRECTRTMALVHRHSLSCVGRSDDLKKHTLRHSLGTGEFPHKCCRCTYACLDLSNYKRHLRAHERRDCRTRRRELAAEVWCVLCRKVAVHIPLGLSYFPRTRVSWLAVRHD